MEEKMSEKEQYYAEKRAVHIEQMQNRKNAYGLRLKAFRLSLGLSQSELADKLDVTQSTINHVENGVRMPSRKLREALLSLYGFDIFKLDMPAPAVSVLPHKGDFTLNENLRYIREDLDISRLDFARATGLGLSTIANIENKVRGVSVAVARRIKETFGIDIYTYKKKEANSYVIPIPFYYMGEAAGLLTTPSDKETLYFDERWLRNILGVKPDNLHLIYASGDSMDSGFNTSTDIHDGDLLLVDTSQTEGNNKVFVIKVNNSELRVKKVNKRLDGTLIITSNNPKYQEEVYSPDEKEVTIEVVGRVVWNGSKENI